jgi:hypothetical protein
MKREGESCERNIASPWPETNKKKKHLDIPLHRKCYSTTKGKRKERGGCCATLFGSTLQFQLEIPSLRTHARAAAVGGPNQKSPHPADDNGLILDQPSFSN